MIVLNFRKQQEEKDSCTTDSTPSVITSQLQQTVKMALAKIPTEMQPTELAYGPNADVNTEITEETTLKEVKDTYTRLINN